MLTLKAVIKAIMELVNDPKTLDKARKSPRFFTRKRKMDFPQLVCFLMNTINNSTQTALNRFFKNILEESTHISQQALSKARSHFDHSPFEGMFRQIVGMRYSFGKKVRKWHGYQVLAVDGSAINLPNLPEIRQIFGGSGRNADSAALVTLSDKTVIRVVKLTLPFGEIETLVTNLRRVKEREFMSLYLNPYLHIVDAKSAL